MWLCCLSCGTQALRCCLQAFSRWAISRCGAQASPCRGFSRFRAWDLGHVGSVVVSRGLSGSVSCGIFLDNGSNMSPALAGEFLITGLPGKPPKLFSIDSILDSRQLGRFLSRN